MRVLVTGPTGFIGQHVVKTLQAAGHSVVGACRNPARTWTCDWITSDLLEPGEPARVVKGARPDVVVHLAWTTETGKYWTDPNNERWAAASLELAEAAIGLGGQRFCGVGTCFEYDWPADADCDEARTPLAEHLPYDTAKAAFRRQLNALADKTGATATWARLFYLYGPDEHPNRLVSSVARSIVAGKPADCSTGKVLRDFMDARDAGAALAALAVSDVAGDVNIGAGVGVTVAEIATTLGELAGRPDLVRIGALPDRPNDPPRITAAVGRLRNEVRVPAGRSLRDGLRDALAFWGERVPAASSG